MSQNLITLPYSHPSGCFPQSATLHQRWQNIFCEVMMTKRLSPVEKKFLSYFTNSWQKLDTKIFVFYSYLTFHLSNALNGFLSDQGITTRTRDEFSLIIQYLQLNYNELSTKSQINKKAIAGHFAFLAKVDFLSKWNNQNITNWMVNFDWHSVGWVEVHEHWALESKKLGWQRGFK